MSFSQAWNPFMNKPFYTMMPFSVKNYFHPVESIPIRVLLVLESLLRNSFPFLVEVRESYHIEKPFLYKSVHMSKRV
jgi:hypothetical protein